MGARQSSVETVRAAVITGYGINADRELAEAFRLAGAEAKLIHISDLLESPEFLQEFRILAFPGGFSFGDHLGSGLVFAHMCKNRLRPALERFIGDGNLIIGICNGFQVLVKMGLLPNLRGVWNQEATLTYNRSGLFIDAWVEVEAENESPCVWTRGLGRIELPIRHGEGRFVMRDESLLSLLENKNCVSLRYRGGNPNGSVNAIAGITDATGRVFGLMPHPEAYLVSENHPRWGRERTGRNGMRVFENGVNYLRTLGKQL